MARKPQDPECWEFSMWAACSLWRQPSTISINKHHTHGSHGWLDCTRFHLLLQPAWEQMGDVFREGRWSQDVASVAALRLCGVFNVQRPLVLSAIFSSLQNHFRAVKWKCKRWPGVEGRLGEKNQTTLPLDSQAIFTALVHTAHTLGGNYLKLFSLKEKNPIWVCVYEYTYTVSILGFHLNLI